MGFPLLVMGQRYQSAAETQPAVAEVPLRHFWQAGQK
jgi:hypothetical protein